MTRRRKPQRESLIMVGNQSLLYSCQPCISFLGLVTKCGNKECGLKQRNLFLQFRMLEVQNQGVGRAVLSLKALGNPGVAPGFLALRKQNSNFGLSLHMAFWSHMSLCLPLFLERHQPLDISPILTPG